MSDVREPMTPADCDLKDFAYMPLDVARLRQSEMASDESPESCWAAVLLWCASWHEIPAGSIPDNDQWQAKQAGYVARGKVDKAWADVRDGALRGFVKCADGRLYHPVVSEKARESWDSKLRHAYGKMQERLRKLNKQRSEKRLPSMDAPTFEQWISGGKTDPVPLESASRANGTPPESGMPSAGIPPEKPLKGEGKGEGIDNPSSLRSEGEGAGAPPSPPAKPGKPKREDCTLATFLANCKAEGVKYVPDDHAIRRWAADAGISDEMLQVAWIAFRERYTDDAQYRGKRYRDWPAHFANSVKDSWFGLWYRSEDGGSMQWSSKGLTRKQALDARHSQPQGGAHAPE